MTGEGLRTMERGSMAVEGRPFGGGGGWRLGSIAISGRRGPHRVWWQLLAVRMGIA